MLLLFYLFHQYLLFLLILLHLSLYSSPLSQLINFLHYLLTPYIYLLQIGTMVNSWTLLIVCLVNHLILNLIISNLVKVVIYFYITLFLFTQYRISTISPIFILVIKFTPLFPISLLIFFLIFLCRPFLLLLHLTKFPFSIIFVIHRFNPLKWFVIFFLANSIISLLTFWYLIIATFFLKMLHFFITIHQAGCWTKILLVNFEFSLLVLLILFFELRIQQLSLCW